MTFLDADGEESTETFTATVQNNTATFALPGNLNPTNLRITFDGLVLDDQPVVAQDAPCTPKPPVFKDLEVTCDAITITTTDVPEGDTLSAEVTFVGDIVETYNVPVDADGVAVIPLPGDLDPSYLRVFYDDETLFDGNIQASDAPCAEVPPKPRSRRRKKGKRYRKKKRVQTQETRVREGQKKYEKGSAKKSEVRKKKRAYERKKCEYERYRKRCK